MTASVLMIQGCASSVGKSVVVAGLCRVLARRGVSVAPFKAQNLALNSSVTEEGLEIGRSTAVQAEAAGVVATVDMNPVLLKYEGNGEFQVVLLGKAISKEDGAKVKGELGGVVSDALARLREVHDVVVIEGAGSPAEINLVERDVVNMHVARVANAPVLLVGDIERGGVFAHFAGTLQLLEEEDRARVAGLVINKFHGDLGLLEPGIRMIEERVGVPVLGVVPSIPRLRIADEDSVALEDRGGGRRGEDGALDVAVLRFPHLSNHDDFLALEHEDGVVLRYVDSARGLEGADLVVLPGTKNTRADLAWLRASGIDGVVRQRVVEGKPVIGICGGYQMLGQSIEDSAGVEGPAGTEAGLGVLPLRTVFENTKTTVRRSLVLAESARGCLFAGGMDGERVRGYEIHMGRVRLDEQAPALFRDPESGALEGTWQGSVCGTLLHGLFENEGVRAALLQSLRGGEGALVSSIDSADAEYERLADVLEASLDMQRIDALLEAQRG